MDTTNQQFEESDFIIEQALKRNGEITLKRGTELLDTQGRIHIIPGTQYISKKHFWVTTDLGRFIPNAFIYMNQPK